MARKRVPEAQCKKFIADIAPIAQKAYKELGKVYPSICIAMACVESAYGTSKVMAEHNAYLGHKVGSGKTALKYWDGTFFNAQTSEEYTIGTHTAIRDNFRSFRDMQQCVFNYYELLNSDVYKRVKADVPYTTQMEQIKEVGYMTSSTEVNTVKEIIQQYKLTKYDQISQDKPKRRVLKKGMTGDDVKELQTILIKLGCDLGKWGADGQFGKQTDLAVRKLQSDFKLVVDGKVGPKTYEVLEKYM